MKRSIWLIYLSSKNKNHCNLLSNRVQLGCRDKLQCQASDKRGNILASYHGDWVVTEYDWWACSGSACLCYNYCGLCNMEPNIDFPCPRMNVFNFKKYQLSGSHGEWTMSDDVVGQEINDENKRKHKEAKNKIYKRGWETQNPANAARRKHQQDRKLADVAAQTEKSKTIVAAEELANADFVPPPEQQEKKEFKYLVHFKLFEFDFYTRSNGKNSFQVTDSMRDDECGAEPGSMKNWQLNKDGISYKQNYGKNRVALPNHVIVKFVPSFEFKNYSGDTISVDKSQHMIYLPLLKLLQRNWQTPDYSLSRETAIRNMAMKAFAESCDTISGAKYFHLQDLFSATTEYFILTWIAKAQSIDLLGNKNPLINADHVFKTAWYNNYKVEQTDTFIKVNPSARHLPRDEGKYKFKIKPGVTIRSMFNPFGLNDLDVNTRFYEWKTREDTMLETIVGFSYNPDYSICAGELARNYVSVGMDLIPGCWDRSNIYDTRSYLDAIQKRLLGSRDDEASLWMNQQMWLCDVANVYGNLPNEVQAELGVSIKKGVFEHLLVKDPYFGDLYTGLTPQYVRVGCVEKSMTSSIPIPKYKSSLHTRLNRSSVVCDYVQGHHGVHDETAYTANIDKPYVMTTVSPVMDAIDTLLYDTSRSSIGKLADYFNTAAVSLYDGAFSWYAQFYSDYINRETYAYLEGPKRQQRIRVLEGARYMPKTGDCHPSAYLKDEIDKSNPEKPSRIFVSYGDKSSFLDPALISIVKKRIHGRTTRKYTIGGVEVNIDCYTFTTPRASELEKFFNALIDIEHTPNTLVFGCFSDDSVIAWNLPCGIGYANVDISSCDSSNGPLIFSLVWRMLDQLDSESALGYLKQCHKPISCRNPQDPGQEFKILFPTCFEGSGTSLTTILNTVASKIICFSIIEVLIKDPSLTMEQAIIKGAALVGHKVTVDLCTDNKGSFVPEKIQFLKFSPMLVRDGGLFKYVPVRNLGCLIRGLGKTFGDLTPKQLGMTDAEWRTSSAHERFHRYIGGVIQGLKHEPSHPLLAGLRENFKPIAIEELPTLVEADYDYSRFTIEAESMLKRYDIDNESYNQMYLIALELRLGSVVTFPPFVEAMVVDYGLSRREASPTLSTYSKSGVPLRDIQP